MGCQIRGCTCCLIFPIPRLWSLELLVRIVAVSVGI